MVGVVYEVTMKDYTHIIATEGGGASYKDVWVSCYPLTEGDSTVPEFPSTAAFQAHTLFAPEAPPSSPDEGLGRSRRPDPSYAQPSARYLKLITDGADEHDFPPDYTKYLRDIRPYEVRTQGQRMGQFVFEMLWLPFMMFVLSLMQQYQDKNGIVPGWVAKFAAAIFASIWRSYDDFFKPLFGDGERTDYGSKKKGRKWDEEQGLKS